MQRIIMEVLKELCVPAHLSGYKYLIYAIELYINDESYMNQLTRKLYPTIAEKYGTTKQCVERGIRTAIEVSYKKTDKLIYEEYFGKRSNRVAPSEFIATIFYKLKY